MKIDKSQSQVIKQSLKPGFTPLNHKQARTSSLLTKSSGLFEELQGNISKLKGELPLLEPKKHIPPLLSTLNILSGIVEEGKAVKADLLLIEIFLYKWTEKFKERIPGKIQKPLKEIINSLKYLHSHKKSDEVMDLYALQGICQEGNVSWSIKMKEQSLNENDSSEDELFCKLEMESDLLGRVQAVLQEKSGRYSCLFSSDSEKTKKAIKERLKDFRDQLDKRGMEFPLIQIRSIKEENRTLKQRGENEVDIWT